MAELKIYMNDEYVGELLKSANGAHQLIYATDWLTNPKARPLSLSLPLQKSRITSEQLYNYFDNLLPDSQPIRERIVKRFQAVSAQPFDLLSEIGRDSIGAITLLPESIAQTSAPLKNSTLSYETLADEKLISLLQGYKTDTPLGMLKEHKDFRISVAGAQEKTALLKINDSWCVPKGLTPTTYIIKLPIGEIKGPTGRLDLSDSVENEWLCIELARELGFSVPNIEIIKVGDVKALAVERFDRRWTGDRNWLIRLPQEDMCQAHGIPPAIKYESDGGPGIAEIMKLLMGSKNALADRDAFMRFQVFQWLIGATDGHAKNFSIFLEAGGSYRLTPFYDILSAYPILGGKGLNVRDLSLVMGLKASKGKKRKIEMIFPRHFIATARSIGFDIQRMQDILDELAVTLPNSIERLQQRIPTNIPVRIQNAIFSNALKQAQKLTT
jgi:serine/threonine-protein kinase HipA